MRHAGADVGVLAGKAENKALTISTKYQIDMFRRILDRIKMPHSWQGYTFCCCFTKKIKFIISLVCRRYQDFAAMVRL